MISIEAAQLTHAIIEEAKRLHKEPSVVQPFSVLLESCAIEILPPAWSYTVLERNGGWAIDVWQAAPETSPAAGRIYRQPAGHAKRR